MTGRSGRARRLALGLTKAGLGVIGLALVAGAAAPWLIGLHLERRYQQVLDDLTARGYRIERHDWQRGWLRSQAMTLIAGPPAAASSGAPTASPPTPTDPAGSAGSADPPEPRLSIASQFEHGPRADNWRRWPPVLATGQARVGVLDAARPLPALRVAFSLDLHGALGARFSLPDLAYSGAVGQLQFTGVSADLALSGAGGWLGGRLDGQGRLGGLNAIDGSGRRLVVSGLDWRAALIGEVAGLPLGDLRLSLAEVRLDAAPVDPPADPPADPQTERTAGDLSDQPTGAVPVFAARGLRLGIGVSAPASADAAPDAAGPDPGPLSVTAVIEVDELQLPGLDLGPARLVATLSGLDAPALAALRADWRAIDAQGLPPSLHGVAVGGLLLRHLPEVLAAAPQLRAEPLSIGTPDGPVSGSLALGLAPLAGAWPAPDLAPDQSAPAAVPPLTAGFWLQRLRGEGSLHLPEPVIRRWLVGQQRARVGAELARLGADPAALPPTLAAEVDAAAAAALAALLRDRWLVAGGGRLGAAIVIGDGLLTINGRTVPLGVDE